MKVKTSELKDAALDWAVARILGHNVRWYGSPLYCAYVPKGKRSDYKWQPTQNWKQGGPILDHYRVDTVTHGDSAWMAGIFEGKWHAPAHSHYGPTRLVAGLRTVVEYELGDEVEVPDELAKAAT